MFEEIFGWPLASWYNNMFPTAISAAMPFSIICCSIIYYCLKHWNVRTKVCEKYTSADRKPFFIFMGIASMPFFLLDIFLFLWDLFHSWSQIGNQTLKYVYDAYGRPVSCGNDIHEQSIVYDKVGNIASVAEKIDGLMFIKSQTRSAHSRRRQLAQLQPLSLLPWLYISRNFFNSSIFSFAASLPIW